MIKSTDTEIELSQGLYTFQRVLPEFYILCKGHVSTPNGPAPFLPASPHKGKPPEAGASKIMALLWLSSCNSSHVDQQQKTPARLYIHSHLYQDAPHLQGEGWHYLILCGHTRLTTGGFYWLPRQLHCILSLIGFLTLTMMTHRGQFGKPHWPPYRTHFEQHHNEMVQGALKAIQQVK